MITAIPHRNFTKRFVKLLPNEKWRARERTRMFLENPRALLLEDHPLHGEWSGCRGFHVGGDLSVIYRYADEREDVAEFLTLGTHSQLYGE